MSYADDYYKKTTGVSKNNGALISIYNNIKHGLSGSNAKSKNARLRTGLAVLTMAGIIYYASNKEVVDEKLNNIQVNRIEYSNRERQSDRGILRTAPRSNSNDKWIAVPPGSTLSQLARKYHGSYDLYKDLASLNNIENPDLILRKQPLKLLPGSIETNKGIRTCDVPLYEQVLRVETLDEFVKRIDVSASKREIIQYNSKKGNTVSRNHNLLSETDVVYLKKEWL